MLALCFLTPSIGLASADGQACPAPRCSHVPFEILPPGNAGENAPLPSPLSLRMEGGSRDPAFLAARLEPGLDTAERLPARRPTTPVLHPRSRHDWTIGTLNADHDDHYPYRLPYGTGVSYPVLQGYGSRLSHQGAEFFTVDFAMPEGTPVHAAREGIVALVEEAYSEGCWTERCGRLANYVVILHADGTTGEYFHLQRDGVRVSSGEHVASGQWIAVSGNTGYTTTPHLHFGVYGARDRGATQSIGIQFRTRNGLVRELRPGARHLNAD